MTTIDPPLLVKSLKVDEIPFEKIDPAYYVSVRPASGNKTYLGIMIGNAPIYFGSSYNRKTQEIKVDYHHNPAIFIPDLMTVVLGCESWWGKIEKPEDLQQITDADINNVWYVKALKAMSEGKK